MKVTLPAVTSQQVGVAKGLGSRDLLRKMKQSLTSGSM